MRQWILKSYVHGHYRTDPNTGKTVWVKPYANRRRRVPAADQAEFAFARDAEDVPILAREPASTKDEEAILQAAQAIIRKRWPKRGRIVADAPSAYTAFAVFFGNRNTEMIAAIFLDSGNHMIAIEPVSEGTVDGSAVYPREVLRAAVLHDATGVILAHNHPSGRNGPSEADRHMTRRVAAGLRAIDVRLLDHLVLGKPDESGSQGYYSFADHREASLA